MKKSTLLSLLTAASIVVTTAVTYAVWDTTTDDTTASVTFRNPVTVSVAPTYSLTTGAAAIGQIPTASGDVTFTVDNQGNLAKQLTLKPTVSGYSGASTEHFEFKITDEKENLKPDLSGNASAGFSDTTLNSTTYKVSVTPKEDYKSKIAGQAVEIQLTAELS